MVGVAAVGVLAFGVSLKLEGAPVPGGIGKSTDRAVAANEVGLAKTGSARETDQNRALREIAGTVRFGNLANLPNGDLPVMPVIRVDYRDDEGTRMREAGLLNGPLPLPKYELGSVAAGGCGAGGCSFNFECDDGNPCTQDACSLQAGQPAGTGSCTCTVVPDGLDGSLGNATCEANFGLLCLGCDDGLFCNGVETCQGGACADGPDPCTGIQACSETLDLCHDACTSNAECINLNASTALHCNGSETCDIPNGVCIAGTNPCGTGANCGERRCTLLPGNPPTCITNEDCAGGGGTCTVVGPICFPGRCCLPGTAGEPACARRVKCDDAGGGP